MPNLEESDTHVLQHVELVELGQLPRVVVPIAVVRVHVRRPEQARLAVKAQRSQRNISQPREISDSHRFAPLVSFLRCRLQVDVTSRSSGNSAWNGSGREECGRPRRWREECRFLVPEPYSFGRPGRRLYFLLTAN